MTPANPENTRRLTNAGLMFAHCLRRRPNIKPALVKILVFVGNVRSTITCEVKHGGGITFMSIDQLNSQLWLFVPYPKGFQRCSPKKNGHLTQNTLSIKWHFIWLKTYIYWYTWVIYMYWLSSVIQFSSVHLKLGLLTQVPASNNEKYFYLWKMVICKMLFLD